MAKLRVLQSWKGDFAPNTWVEVVSDPDSRLSGDGYAAEQDSAIIVYADKNEPVSLASCSLTGPLDSATSYIPLLNRLSKRQRRGVK